MIIILLITMLADPWADASPSVEYGSGAGYGQSYYPENILGPPDPTATPSSPAFGESNLLTLGKNGWVVLEFTDNSIVNEQGADFSVFENVLDTGSGYFQECAFVEVSQDGQYWIHFPWDAETLEGLAGVMPTTGEDPTNPAVSGGDQFDLETLELDWIRFIRLTDCGDSVSDGGLFDLDAIAAINWTTGIEEENVTPQISITSPFSSSFSITAEETGVLSCYTIDGRKLEQWTLEGQSSTLNSLSLPPGILFFVLNGSTASAVKLCH